MRVAAVIPARFGSTRFTGKPLALICGKPMIQHVYENACSCGLVDRVVVATDDDAVHAAVLAFGGEVRMTAPEHQTGTDRIAEVARDLDAELIVNVQGDEPLLPPAAIAEAVAPLLADAGIMMGTLKTRLRAGDDPLDPNIVKVVSDRNGRALYFSRSPLPYVRDRGQACALYRHVGLYVFRREFLFRFTGLERTALEQAESLEQLRALEHGFPVFVAETDYYPVGVDVPEDIRRVETLIVRQV